MDVQLVQEVVVKEVYLKTFSLNSENLLLIFTRNPELGKVKSRLAAEIGNHAALNIYTFLLEHTHKVTQPLSVEKQVWYSENVPESDLWNSGDFSKHLQEGDDLGERMQHAFQKGFNDGYKHIIIIGSDLYDITQSDIETAFNLLQQNEAVVGPATDGGFYLLGLSKFIPDLFTNKKWGTDSVLKAVLTDLKNYSIQQLNAKNDVDYLSDIKDVPIFKQFIAP